MQTTHLQPNYPSHIKDKKHFLNLIEKPPPLPPNAVLVTADVTSLYTNIPHEEGIAAVIHFMEEYKHLLPTNCPPPHIVRIILDFILKHSTFKFMDTHICQILGTSMGTRMAPPYASLFMGKEERTIILTFLHLIYFWKSFIDDIFFIFLGSHSQLKSLMTFMNTISPTIKYTFTFSEKTVTFLDVEIYLSETRKLQTKFYKKPTDCMTLLHFHSHHPLSCKEGIIYSQTLRYNMIISEDHILQEELNNLRRILLARAYPLHLIIKNIKKAMTFNNNYVLSQRTPQTKTNILPIVIPFSDIGKLLTAIIYKNWNYITNGTTLSNIRPSKPLSACTKSNSIHNHLVHSAQAYGYSRQDSKHYYPHTPTYTNTGTPTVIYHGNKTVVVSLVSSSIPDKPNYSWYYGQSLGHQDMLWRSKYHPTTMGHTNALTLMLIIYKVQLYVVNKNLFGLNNIFLYILCHHEVFSVRDFQANTLQPLPGLTSIVIDYPHRVPPPRISSTFFYPGTYLHLAGQSWHTRTNNFCPYMVFECRHNIGN